MIDKVAEAELTLQPEKTAALVKRLVKVESVSNRSIPFYDNCGAINHDKAAFDKRRLAVPENFFISRYSLREFSCAK